jgi:hypothetical protein
VNGAATLAFPMNAQVAARLDEAAQLLEQQKAKLSPKCQQTLATLR